MAIHRMKYRDRPQLAEPLGVALAAFVLHGDSPIAPKAIDCIMPVPMTPGRQRVRGYNQAERIARVVARELELEIDTRTLIRQRNVRPQVGLTRAARQQNLAGVFKVRDRNVVTNRSILVMDDVTTTGSTLHETASTLKSAGAVAVYGLTLAAG